MTLSEAHSFPMSAQGNIFSLCAVPRADGADRVLAASISRTVQARGKERETREAMQTERREEEKLRIEECMSSG